MHRNHSVLVMVGTVMVAGCATVPLTEQVMGRPLSVATDQRGENVAEIIFSADRRYESVAGVPLQGDPMLCTRDGVFRVNEEGTRKDRIKVRAGEEVAVSSVIRWINSYWEKTCWPLMAFTPESGATYVVVNERMGGKGWSALWTGVAFQHCEVSVYKLDDGGQQKISTSSPSLQACRRH